MTGGHFLLEDEGSMESKVCYKRAVGDARGKSNGVFE